MQRLSLSQSKTGTKRFNLNRVRVLIFVMNDINFKGSRRYMIIYLNHDLCCNTLTRISATICISSLQVIFANLLKNDLDMHNKKFRKIFKPPPPLPPLVLQSTFLKLQAAAVN